MPESAPPDVSPQFQTFLAFDFGARRTGVAVGNRMLRTATAQPTIRAEAADDRLAQAEQRIREWQPDALVVGVPFHPDGASHDNTARARKFARQLRGPLASRCTRWTSATAPPRRWPAARATRMRAPPASSWNNS